MTNEEKELLFKDICGRLLYRVKFACNKNVYTAKGLDLIVTDEGNWEYAVTAKGIEPIEISFIKPYIRSMSSMTDDEREEYRKLGGVMSYNSEHDTWTIYAFTPEAYDWLNKKMFDYRGLIPMGIAIEANNDMYSIKTE